MNGAELATLVLHIVAGGVAIVLGFVALYAVKGATLHRKSGLLFVYAMVVMGISATIVAMARGIEGSILGGLLSTYLVVTALTTVRERTDDTRRLDFGMMLLAVAIGTGLIAVGFKTAAMPGRTMDGIPAAPSFINGVIALLASGSDLRALRADGLRGAKRLARHLWRMCFALFIATGSFFLGQADEFPEEIRIFPVLAALAFAPLIVMLYWLWRLRAGTRRRSYQLEAQ